MRPREIPVDDLYARLELPVGAEPAAVEIAWRTLLKRHHPDVAGAESLQLAKQINIAHDWLSDPQLRARYDRARHPAGLPGSAAAAGRSIRATRSPRQPTGVGAWRPVEFVEEPAPREVDLDSPHVAAFLARIGRLTNDELDRLSLAEPPPIAFVASIRRFLSGDRFAVLSALEAAIDDRLHGRARREPRIRQAIMSYGHDLVLERFLEEALSEPFRERVHERMVRGWQSAVGRRRYGAHSSGVETFLEAARQLSPDEARRLIQAATPLELTVPPWPPGAHPSEDDVLRVSAELASRDARSIARGRLPPLESSRLAEALGYIAHVVALGSAFSPAARRRLLKPWLSVVGERA